MVHVDGVGETEFEIYPEEITEAIKAGLEEPIYPEPEVCWLFSIFSWFGVPFGTSVN